MHVSPEREAELRSQASLGQRAHGFLEDPLFRDAVESIRNECRREFENSALNEQGDRHRLVARLKIDVMEDIITKMRAHVRRGIVAADDLSLWERFKEKMGKRKAA